MVTASFNMVFDTIFPHGGLPLVEGSCLHEGNRKMSSSNTRTSFGNPERILAILFVLGAVVGFLLTPLGFETRINELRSTAFAVFFVIVGLLIPIAGFILLFLNQSSPACWRLSVLRSTSSFHPPTRHGSSSRSLLRLPSPSVSTSSSLWGSDTCCTDHWCMPSTEPVGRPEPRSITLERASFPVRRKDQVKGDMANGHRPGTRSSEGYRTNGLPGGSIWI